MKIYQVDAFTEKPFSGNPAGVCVLNEKLDEKIMQNIAREINLSETAFLVKSNEEYDLRYDLRWFTPEGEIDLCGHATLASAHILWEKGFLKNDQEARFSTKSGLLTAIMNNGWIELNFPALPEEKTEPPAGLLESLGIEATYVGKNIFDYLIEVESEETVRTMKPDFVKLSKVPARGGVIVTARSRTGEYDFVSRFFAPEIGIWEDPVTGSAHCCLGPYWQKRLNKDEFIAYQASERGGGVLKVKVAGERVLISGKAVMVLEGELLI